MFSYRSQSIVTLILVAVMATAGVVQGNVRTPCLCGLCKSGSVACCQRTESPVKAKKASCPYCQQCRPASEGTKWSSTRLECRCGCGELYPLVPACRTVETAIDLHVLSVSSLPQLAPFTVSCDAIDTAGEPPLALGPTIQRLHCIWRL